jgi:uncharacterized membrane protein
MNTNVSEAPSNGAWWQRLTLWHAMLLFVVIGIGITSYLSYLKLPGITVEMVCPVGGGLFNCDAVQNSSYSRIAGVPIAWLGWGCYLVLLALLATEKRLPIMRDYGIVLQFGVIFFAFLYSMYLVYLQFVVLQALCMWCLMHEATMTVLMLLIAVRLYRYFNDGDAEVWSAS